MHFTCSKKSDENSFRPDSRRTRVVFDYFLSVQQNAYVYNGNAIINTARGVGSRSKTVRKTPRELLLIFYQKRVKSPRRTDRKYQSFRLVSDTRSSICFRFISTTYTTNNVPIRPIRRTRRKRRFSPPSLFVETKTVDNTRCAVFVPSVRIGDSDVVVEPPKCPCARR